MTEKNIVERLENAQGLLVEASAEIANQQSTIKELAGALSRWMDAVDRMAVHGLCDASDFQVELTQSHNLLSRLNLEKDNG